MNKHTKKCKSILLLALSTILATSFLAGCSNTTPPTPISSDSTTQPNNTKITILSTSDLHSNIWGYAYEDNKETENNGIARVYSYIEEVRKEQPDAILIDSGDTIQGNILTDDLYNKQEGEHPVISAMNFMKYDSMTLGNHEFNFGLDLIERIKKQADFPLLSANITYKDNGKKFVEPYKIIERNGVRIGIIGATTPNVPRWDGEKVDSLIFDDMALSVRNVVNEIKDETDILIVSAHAGMVAEFDEENNSDAAAKILELSPEIDVLSIGHMHITVNDKVNDTIVGGTRSSGREVARFDLTLDADKNVIDATTTIVDMADYTPSESIRTIPIVAKAHQDTIDFIAGGIKNDDGSTTGGVFGVASKDFQPVDEIKGIPQGKLQDTAVVDLINKIQLLNSGADVSSAALFKDTSDIKKGDINYGGIFNIYKFDNTLCRIPVTGKELKSYMEWSAACYNQFVPGDLSISFNSEKPGYLYDMFAGVDYKIDLSKPEGERIVDVMFKGKPLQDDQQLTLAVNNYRYASALKTENLVAGKKDWESPNSIRDMIVEYITKEKTISPEVDNNWSIIGVNLTSPYREQAIKLVEDGTIESPYGVSLNENELKKQGLLK
ncbi:MAG: 5'-nucleotidase C-terminal domain-containing protein [Oscillospiraceae bacterium]